MVTGMVERTKSEDGDGLSRETGEEEWCRLSSRHCHTASRREASSFMDDALELLEMEGIITEDNRLWWRW